VIINKRITAPALLLAPTCHLPRSSASFLVSSCLSDDNQTHRSNINCGHRWRPHRDGVQGLAYVSSQWTVGIRCLVTCQRVNHVESSTMVRVRPLAHAGQPALLSVKPPIVDDVTGAVRLPLHFEYNKQLYSFGAPEVGDSSVCVTKAGSLFLMPV
jgi:hypothetical protein